jgi:hypothetical protein
MSRVVKIPSQMARAAPELAIDTRCVAADARKHRGGKAQAPVSRASAALPKRHGVSGVPAQ